MRHAAAYYMPFLNPFFVGRDNAPAIGLPIRMPTEAEAQTIPILAPTTFMLGLRTATIEAGKTAIGPEDRPQRTEKATKPPSV